jgi:hypothetical protein
MSELGIESDWVPTPANVNALPEPLRRFIHDLETVYDPAGDVAELFRLRKEKSCFAGSVSDSRRRQGKARHDRASPRTQSSERRRV